MSFRRVPLKFLTYTAKLPLRRRPDHFALFNMDPRRQKVDIGLLDFFPRCPFGVVERRGLFACGSGGALLRKVPFKLDRVIHLCRLWPWRNWIGYVIAARKDATFVGPLKLDYRLLAAVVAADVRHARFEVFNLENPAHAASAWNVFTPNRYDHSTSGTHRIVPPCSSVHCQSTQSSIAVDR